MSCLGPWKFHCKMGQHQGAGVIWRKLVNAAYPKFKSLTRRTFLKRGAGLLVGVTLSQGVRCAVPRATFAALSRKRIYLAPDDHTDYFWAAGEERYREVFLSTLDYYLDQADATIAAGNAPEHQGRWNCDGSFWMWEYGRNRTAVQFQRLIDRIKSGHISVPLNALCVCLGGAPLEAIVRGMYYAGKMERQYGVRFRLAYTLENATQPYGLSSLWWGSGARFSWKGICNCDTAVTGADHREHEIYWAEGPDGNRVLMKWNSLRSPGDNTSIGGYAEARRPDDVVEYVSTDPTFRARYPFDVIGAFGQGWDDVETKGSKLVTTAREKTNPDRLVIVSNEEDFFEDFAATYGQQIPVVACSFGNEWDLYCAALAEQSARVKRAVEKLRSAESMSVLVAAHQPSFWDGRSAARDQTWMNFGLFWEHNFGMVGPPSGLVDERVAWQKRLAHEIASYVDTLYEDAKVALGSLIGNRGENERFYVFNPLSWVRTDFVDFAYAGNTPVHTIDLVTGQEAPSQLVSVEDMQYLRVLVENIPSLGYKVFELRAGPGASFPEALRADAGSGVIENEFFRVTVAPRGAITSFVAKDQSNREFAKSIDGYAINDLGPSTGKLVLENAGPVSVTLVATADAPIRHTTRITLFRQLRRVEIRNEITQNFEDTQQWRFGFRLDAPEVWHEEVGAVICAKKVSQAGHYTDRSENGRFDWLTINHFADMSGSDHVGMTLANADCYFMRLGNSTALDLDVITPQIALLAGGRVVKFTNGLPHQGGDDHFVQRFAMRSHTGYSAASAMQFALEHQNPLIAGRVSGGTVYPESEFSFGAVSNPDVLVWAFKPADDGAELGAMVRVWNLSAATTAADLTLSTPIVAAERCTHIETSEGAASIKDGALTFSIAKNQIASFLVRTDSMPSVSTPTPAATPPCEPGAADCERAFLPTIDKSVSTSQ